MKKLQTKTRNLKPVTYNLKSGFTLIEILIATTIFVTVVVIGVGSFTAQSSTQRKVNTIRTVSASLRQIGDQISGEVRQANGQFQYLKKEYRGFIVVKDTGQVASNAESGTRLIVSFIDPVTDKNVVKLYRLRTVGNRTVIRVKEIKDISTTINITTSDFVNDCSTVGGTSYCFKDLTSQSDIKVTNLAFMGVKPGDPDQRPYLKIKATFDSTRPLRSNQPYSETYDSTVTWRIHEN